MNIQSLCPYGLKSLMECASRATLLSQPADIPNFLLQYMSEQITFRKSQPEDDPKVVSFNYQKIFEKNMLRKTETPIATIETSVQTPGTRQLLPTPIPQKPTPADKASTSMVPSQPSKTPAIPVPVVKCKLVPPPIPEEKADEASTSRAISQPSKTPAIPVPVVKRRLVPPPIPDEKADNASTSRAISQPSKTPAIPVPVVKRRLVPPPIPEEKADNASTSKAISQPSKTPAIPVPVVKRRLVPPPIPNEKADNASTSRAISQPSKTPAIPVPVVKRRLVPPPIPNEKADNASTSRAISQPSKTPAIPVPVVKRRLVPPPIPNEKADNASTSKAISQPSKTPAIPVPVVKRRLVPPPIPDEKTRGVRTSEKEILGKAETQNAKIKTSVPPADKASASRAISQPSKTPRIPVQVVRRRLVPPPIPEEKRGVRISETKILRKTETQTHNIKTVKPKQKGSGILRPESTKESKEAGTESNKPKAKVQEKSSQPNQLPDMSRGDRVLWMDRERVKPILNREVGGVQKKAFCRPALVVEGKCFPNLHGLSTPIIIIKYRRIHVRASPYSQSSPSLNSYGL
ncbi:titin-like [Gymnodraco acuticeps]|uniref:Titin-like n=1 Tax=Gymnodraco acuticeps TaxID=8218 RepID=A0A6P8W017_GYMAC|nr:titin-like [Gymnodraco acuticeps]